MIIMITDTAVYVILQTFSIFSYLYATSFFMGLHDSIIVEYILFLLEFELFVRKIWSFNKKVGNQVETIQLSLVNLKFDKL